MFLSFLCQQYYAAFGSDQEIPFLHAIGLYTAHDAHVRNAVVGEGVVVIDYEEHLNSEFRIVNSELFYFGKGLCPTYGLC